MMSREEILTIVRTAMVELFELDTAQIVLSARFNDDLEIDSIDSVDLMDHLARVFQRQVRPQDFRNVRTVQDLVDTIERMQGQ